MTTVDDDFFDEVETAKYGVENGRYNYPAPPGCERPRGGWMRMTNLAGAFADQRALQRWINWMTLRGIRAHEDVYDTLCAAPLEAMTEEEQKAWCERLADDVRRRVGAESGADRGTARHTMMETYLRTGQVTGTRSMRLQLESLLEAMESQELDFLDGWSERRVCNPDFGVVGTLDAGVLCRRTGETGIIDLKTLKKFYTWQESAAQQYGYDSAPWVWEGPSDDRGRWVHAPQWTMTGRSEELSGVRVALLIHMPQAPGPGQLPVQIKEVSLAYGKDVLETALRNVELRSIGRSVATGRRVGLDRPAPVLASQL